MSEKEKIVKGYVVSGVPLSSMPKLCKELKVNYNDFEKFMFGQTMGLIGGETIIYECDILNFLSVERFFD